MASILNADPGSNGMPIHKSSTTWPNRSQLVVAVRETNPVSFTDWIKGDLDVATLVPWPFDEGLPGARERVKLSSQRRSRDVRSSTQMGT